MEARQDDAAGGGRHHLVARRGDVRFYAREAIPPGWFGPSGRISDEGEDVERWDWPGPRRGVTGPG